MCWGGGGGGGNSEISKKLQIKLLRINTSDIAKIKGGAANLYGKLNYNVLGQKLMFKREYG